MRGIGEGRGGCWDDKEERPFALAEEEEEEALWKEAGLSGLLWLM
jgi:hypothetical protein